MSTSFLGTAASLHMWRAPLNRSPHKYKDLHRLLYELQSANFRPPIARGHSSSVPQMAQQGPWRCALPHETCGSAMIHLFPDTSLLRARYLLDSL